MMIDAGMVPSSQLATSSAPHNPKSPGFGTLRATWSRYHGATLATRLLNNRPSKPGLCPSARPSSKNSF